VQQAIHVSKSQIKAKALEYFRQIEATGDNLIVTDYGKPTLEIRPYQNKKAKPLELLRGSVLKFEQPCDPVAQDDWESA
jgi:antitoxin (DNA-binding transcriptional repressor) of toxin-antitoxin stability system